jgi:hypothetical protein
MWDHSATLDFVTCLFDGEKEANTLPNLSAWGIFRKFPDGFHRQFLRGHVGKWHEWANLPSQAFVSVSPPGSLGSLEAQLVFVVEPRLHRFEFIKIQNLKRFA